MIPGPAGVSERARKLYAVASLVAGLAIAAELWGDRGPLLAVIALLTFGVIAAGVLHAGVRNWLRQRPYLDAFLMFPASLAVVAFITELPLATCLTIAGFLWLVLTVVVTRRRQREQIERDGLGEQGGKGGQGSGPRRR